MDKWTEVEVGGDIEVEGREDADDEDEDGTSFRSNVIWKREL